MRDFKSVGFGLPTFELNRAHAAISIASSLTREKGDWNSHIRL